MRKLKLQVQISVDGFIAGPGGEMDWITWTMSEEIIRHIQDIHRDVDTILLGRKLAQGFIPHWEQVVADTNHPEHDFGHIMVDTPKVVFTKTLNEPDWENTVLAKGELVDEVNRIKNQPGRDIVTYGGAQFVSALIEAGLVDEFHLFFNPAIVGKGMPIFQSVQAPQQLSLVQTVHSSCGIVVLVYGMK